MITLNIILIVFIRYVSQIIDINFFSSYDKHKVSNVRHSLVRDFPRRITNLPHCAITAFLIKLKIKSIVVIRFVLQKSRSIFFSSYDKHKVSNVRHSLVRDFPRRITNLPHCAITAFLIKLKIKSIVVIRFVSQKSRSIFFSNYDKHKVFNVRHSLLRDFPRRMINFTHYATTAIHHYYENNNNCFH